MSPQDIVNWLIRDAPNTLEGLVAGLGTRLVEAGLGVGRLNMSLLAMHPEVEANNATWTPTKGLEVRLLARQDLNAPRFTASPVPLIRAGAPEIRRKLTGSGAVLDFPVCHELAAEGYTEYLILPLQFSEGRISVISFATRQRRGWRSDQVANLKGLLPAIALRTELANATLSTRALLRIFYLGPNAAERVIAGAFVRGSGTSLRCAVWACDLRGYTAMSERLSPLETTRVLDRCFEAVVGPIEAHGGEVLKFIGDAVLAVFPLGDDEAETCDRALKAAIEGRSRIAALPDGVGIGIALHKGEVFYGNVGGAARLDFTVIGPAVNEAFRIESLSKEVAREIVVSEAFRRALPWLPFEDLGEFSLKGVGAARRVFAPITPRS